MTQTPDNGEGFKLGSIAVKGLYTPCHTQDSICWYMQDGDQKAVFTGDTLFHGGTSSLSHTLPRGHCRKAHEALPPTGCGRFFEGTASEMHKALNKTLAALPNDTKVYVGTPLAFPSLWYGGHVYLFELTRTSRATNTPRPTSSSASRSSKRRPSRNCSRMLGATKRPRDTSPSATRR